MDFALRTNRNYLEALKPGKSLPGRLARGNPGAGGLGTHLHIRLRLQLRTAAPQSLALASAAPRDQKYPDTE